MSGHGIGISYKAIKLELRRLLDAGLIPRRGESGLEVFEDCCKRAAGDGRVEGGILSEDKTADKRRRVVDDYVDEILEEAGLEVPDRKKPKKPKKPKEPKK